MIRPLILAILSSCATVQKIDQSTLACADPKISADIPTAIGDLVNNDTKDLEQLGIRDGLEVAFCAVQAAVTALENGGATGPAPMIAGQGTPRTWNNIPAIARGEAWLAVHRK